MTTEQLDKALDELRLGGVRMFSRSMRAWAGAALMVTAVCFAPAGAASASRQDVGGRRYIALGDSLTFGYSALVEDPWIPDRFVGYPEVIERQTHLETTNLACPGQTAQALISLTAMDNGCFDARAWAHEAGVAFLHTEYGGTQLEAAIEAVRSATPPSLITIQGGGNDWFLCAVDNPDPTADPEQCLDDVLPKVTESLRQAVVQLRAAGYRGRVVLVGYHLVQGFEAQLRRLNRAIERAGDLTHVAFADAARSFDRYARRHHGDLCSTGLLVVMPDGSCDPLHPSLTGHRLVAEAVLEAASRRAGAGRR